MLLYVVVWKIYRKFYMSPLQKIWEYDQYRSKLFIILFPIWQVFTEKLQTGKYHNNHIRGTGSCTSCLICDPLKMPTFNFSVLNSRNLSERKLKHLPLLTSASINYCIMLSLIWSGGIMMWYRLTKRTQDLDVLGCTCLDFNSVRWGGDKLGYDVLLRFQITLRTLFHLFLHLSLKTHGMSW